MYSEIYSINPSSYIIQAIALAKALVVCMGGKMDATLLAICSHKPGHLVLCQTAPKKGKDTVNMYVARIKEYAHDLGIQTVETPVFDIDGIYPEQCLPKSPENVELDIDVNITPGTKGQGAMLAWWAKQHGFTVWSLDNESMACAPLYNPRGKQPLPYDLCDPGLYESFN